MLRLPRAVFLLAVWLQISSTWGQSVSWNLGSLNSDTGLVLSKADLGTSFVTGGDFNGDGLSDVVIGAPMDGEGEGDATPGSLFVRLGSVTYSSSVALASSSSVLAVRGLAPYDNFGCAVSVGDVNGDGYADILVGAWGVNYNDGKVYLLFGSPSLRPIDLANLSPSQGIEISPATPKQYLGASVCLVDINGDGYSDLVIGAPGVSLGGMSRRGMLHVLFGKASGWTDRSLSSISPSDGFTIAGSGPNTELGGTLIQAVGDLNHDGIVDLAFGETMSTSTRGTVYILFGHRTALKDLDLSSSSSSSSVTRIIAKAQNWPSEFGFALGRAGDVNGDGMDDFLIGAYNTQIGSTRVGEAFLLYGRTHWPESLNAADGQLAPTDGVIIQGESIGLTAFGYSVDGIGDVNGDGYADVAVTAIASGLSNDGACFVLLGGATWPATFTVTSRTGSPSTGTVVLGRTGDVLLGVSAHAVGDVNGDGRPDWAITTSADRVYVLFGAGGQSIPSRSPTRRPSRTPTAAPTLTNTIPTMSPTLRPTAPPTTSIAPTEQQPPTQLQGALRFESIMTIANIPMSSVTPLRAVSPRTKRSWDEADSAPVHVLLQDRDAQAIADGQANVLSILMSAVSCSTEGEYDANLDQTFVTTTTTIPLEDYPDQTLDSLYATMRDTLYDATQDGQLLTAIQVASEEASSSTFENAIMVNVAAQPAEFVPPPDGDDDDGILAGLTTVVIIAVAVGGSLAIGLAGTFAYCLSLRSTPPPAPTPAPASVPIAGPTMVEEISVAVEMVDVEAYAVTEAHVTTI